MMPNLRNTTCPICRNVSLGACFFESLPRKDSEYYACSACGYYEISRTALHTHILNDGVTPVQRASLSHVIRRGSSEKSPFKINSYWLAEYMVSASLPSIQKQVSNVIQAVGNFATITGANILIKEPELVAVSGSLNGTSLNALIIDMYQAQLISAPQTDQVPEENVTGCIAAWRLRLSFSGWERYEKEKRGELSGQNGFMAMKFGDPELERLFKAVIKPKVKEGTGYDIIEIRERARAGVIDNILREEIRDAAFILADLSHDNNGAYWEAGYAEGLGKPVIYLCEKSKFDETRTHFDTNHCTTVMWDTDDLELFSDQLIATIRRSLNLPPQRVAV